MMPSHSPVVARRFLVPALALATLVGAEGLGAQRSAVPSTADARTVTHVLNRLTFGPRPGDVERVRQHGLAAFIEEQLHPERIADAALAERIAGFTTLTMSQDEMSEKIFSPAAELRAAQQRQQRQQAATAAADPTMMAGQTPPPQRQMLTPEERQIQQRQQNVQQELMQAKVLRAVMSERQLEEVLVDFWFNHFNVFVNKGQVRQYLTSYERDAIRPHVLGNFRDMLGATAHHPAMLFYLDNFQNRTPNPPVVINERLEQRLRDPRLTERQRIQIMDDLQRRQNQQRRPQGGLNENYARELLELHTLGVDGGYTQQDVIEVARILTGWTIDRPQQGGGFVFRPQMHDQGPKKVLGRTFAPNGEAEGERLLDMLASHPATARHISFKLAQRFVADEPPAALVDRVAKVFLDSKGDLRAVTRAVVTSPEFFAADAYRAKVKTPFEFTVSAMRATNATLVNAQPVVQALREALAMPLYGCQPPTGYSMTADAWVNTGALLNRMNFALQLVAGGQAMRVGGPGRAGQPQRPAQPFGAQRGGAQLRPNQMARMPIQIDVQALATDTSDAARDRLIDALLAGEASAATKQTLARAESPQQLIALTLGSPEFQRR
jgi:uncharacterized protein (DUF1800 family)